MKILAFAIIIIVYDALAEVINTGCNEIIVHNIKHEKQVLLDIETLPNRVALDYDTNTLFFSFKNDHRSTPFNIAYLNLKNGEFNIIEGINEGFACAVDSRTSTVYLGGNDGLYKFNYETKQAVHVDGTSHNIWHLFYKNNLYYTTYPNEELYIFKNRKTERVPQFKNTRVRKFAIDNYDNIYFANSSGLYVHKKLKNCISFLGNYSVYDFTSDSNGNLYFSTSSGIHFIDDTSSEIELIASLSKVFRIAIELDGSIIIAESKFFYRLVPTTKQCL